jgi:hypothetical protein
MVFHHQKIKDVGEYEIVAEFIVDSNYNKPSNLTGKFKILPKPIFVDLYNHTNLIENGNSHNVGVRFSGVIDGDIIDYDFVISPMPVVEAGTYVVTVTNNNTNYYIANSNILTFVVKVSSKVFETDDFSFTATGNGFMPDSKLSVEVSQDVSNNYEELSSANKLNKIKILLDDTNNSEPMTISLKTNSIDVTKSRHIKLYRITDGELVQIDYKVENGCLVFEAGNLDEFILVEEKQSISTGIIIGIIVAIVACIGGVVTTIVVIKVKKRK